jgi:non-ribosomal peptide synthetase component F
VTLGTLIQVSWSVLLSRYSGQDDVLFGATRACRILRTTAPSPTSVLLMNTVPMRVQLPPDLPGAAVPQERPREWVDIRAS